MLVIDADERRRIDLPGVGPCPRPVDIDQRLTGFSWLKSLRIYRFSPGAPIHGESEVDEVFILPLAGAFDITVTGAFGLTTQLAATGPVQALYMTPHHGYRLAPCGETVVAYARAEAEGRVPVQAVAAAVSIGLAERLQFHLVDLSFGAALALPEGEVLFHVRDGGLRVETTVGGVVPVTAGQTIALPNDRPVSIRALAPTRVLVLSALGPPKTAV